ncbi:hypothetical protein ACQPZP_04880 [Spirillospora sp. CA-142024]|uniref:hypothetical protein n=1 Tax=Spirillospora sp. CA-142024 TaxID=3240036 RepID=UPI003D939243
MNTGRRLMDLVAFIAVLATGIILVAVGVEPEALAIVVVALGGLYNAWNGTKTARNDRGSSSAEERE